MWFTELVKILLPSLRKNRVDTMITLQIIACAPLFGLYFADRSANDLTLDLFIIQFPYVGVVFCISTFLFIESFKSMTVFWLDVKKRHEENQDSKS